RGAALDSVRRRLRLLAAAHLGKVFLFEVARTLRGLGSRAHRDRHPVGIAEAVGAHVPNLGALIRRRPRLAAATTQPALDRRPHRVGPVPPPAALASYVSAAPTRDADRGAIQSPTLALERFPACLRSDLCRHSLGERCELLGRQRAEPEAFTVRTLDVGLATPASKLSAHRVVVRRADRSRREVSRKALAKTFRRRDRPGGACSCSCHWVSFRSSVAASKGALVGNGWGVRRFRSAGSCAATL